MFNIRMRASRSGSGPHSEEVHVSGAEGIYDETERQAVVERYVRRALDHPRGSPDKIVVTIEKVRRKPRMVRTLPVTTVRCVSPSEAEEIIERILKNAGVSGAAVRTARRVLDSGSMRGASLVSALSGKRVEPDKARGVRASKLGITRDAEKSLSEMLSREGINTSTVREALVLATKVAGCRAIMAEVCMSDNPDYTTGYVASRRHGYVRIPHIKKMSSRRGGRVFFLGEPVDINRIVQFLEGSPVVVNEVGGIRGTVSVDEICGPHM